jgi:ABC-type bacteriocin/lantibiotic exporter with double-glycine peptidase domain
VDALLGSLKQRGYPKAEGVALSSIGLRAQKLPLIALVAPGHFVLVEKIATDGSVTIWDANNTTHTGEARTLTATQWQELWQGGVALTLSAPQPLDTKEV